SLLPRLRPFTLLAVGLVVSAPGMITSTLASPLTKLQITTAAQILCQALAAGQAPEVARDAATAYLLEQVEDQHQLSPNIIRRQMRPVVTKQCPEQARKLKNL
ncbi:MAG: hypothetical protein RLZZ568_686, partial [Cyanobacteriota bacterium]